MALDNRFVTTPHEQNLTAVKNGSCLYLLGPDTAPLMSFCSKDPLKIAASYRGSLAFIPMQYADALLDFAREFGGAHHVDALQIRQSAYHTRKLKRKQTFDSRL